MLASTLERPAEARPFERKRIGPRTADLFADRFSIAPVKTLPAKEHLFCEGDPATHVYRVEAGHIVLYRTMSDGRRQVVDFAYPGDIVGLGSLDEHGCHAQASTKTVVRCLPVQQIWELAANNPRIGLKLYEAISRELTASRELLFTVSQRTATERLAAFLIGLSNRNERRGQNPCEIVLPMTRSDIADFLGLTIETVSRTFTRFRAEGLIDLEQCILVTLRDRSLLRAIAAGEGRREH
jgi:CRP/FNR family transcriptional regulator